ncbi:hypothetical protein JOB18_029765 [Solea senegalensis]|uniref:Uncharacterized protein n=1 Tax=Solea senegalensis TaxID=28829 RepID=A0AAV6PUN3_SOLSE|nr:hypothetical protein JOB18_029765 [Solea senegalensis]
MPASCAHQRRSVRRSVPAALRCSAGKRLRSGSQWKHKRSQHRVTVRQTCPPPCPPSPSSVTSLTCACSHLRHVRLWCGSHAQSLR